MPVRHAGQLRAGLLRSRVRASDTGSGDTRASQALGHLHAGCRKESPCFPREQCSPSPFHKEVDKNAWKMKPPPSATRCTRGMRNPKGPREEQ